MGAPEPALSEKRGSVSSRTGPSHLGTGDRTNPSSPAHPVELIHHWLHKGGIVLHFSGVDSISAAEALTGLLVAIPLGERAPLAAGEVYIGDLVGCTLVDIAGPAPVNVGLIEDVDRTAGPAPLLVVHGALGEVLVPFASSYLRKIDLTAKRVEMALPEGLTGLNAR
jgi:16S rRNA processing protein RimM